MMNNVKLVDITLGFQSKDMSELGLCATFSSKIDNFVTSLLELLHTLMKIIIKKVFLDVNDISFAMV